ncbi:helix-turn-helix transcriptional regulator [Actinomycetaceae bacterium WB03_NA08]|uniref:Helix-turn-helix transcriptional regulator n=1 Tax=Scrofimicrobium canadense TaxID=2652290 RepID=A0A6N7W615_9ACTO|nr:helix-turn-helix transcriptional regulator [Scrofimicrobium canadense]MSS83588.1 helix-turn-helix transcriptional regulator [Scrofimicrobium canadense]
MENKYPEHLSKYAPVTPLLRVELGEVLRSLRLSQGRTLREVSADAQVSLGYLSEVERGQKEASSELLQSICEALAVPLWWVLREVSDRMSLVNSVPDTVPDDLLPVPTA